MKSKKKLFFYDRVLFAFLFTFTVMSFASAEDWTKKADMPTPRVFLGAGTPNNKIYAVGGVAEGLGPAILPTLEAFAPSLHVSVLGKFITFWGKIKTIY